jgi:hypothetical protein
MMNDFPGGVVPYEMQIIKLAKFLNTTPWELEQRPLRWLEYARIMQIAETRAGNATYSTQKVG